MCVLCACVFVCACVSSELLCVHVSVWACVRCVG